MNKRKIYLFFGYLVLILIAFSMLFPFVAMLNIALSNENEIFNSMDEVFKDIIEEDGCVFEFYDDKPVDVGNILNESGERVNAGNKIGGKIGDKIGKKIGGKIGSPAKKIMVTENLKRSPKKLKALKRNDKKIIKEGTIFESISKLIEYSGYTNYQVQKMIKEGKILYVND